jgi:hypothetical protein
MAVARQSQQDQSVTMVGSKEQPLRRVTREADGSQGSGSTVDASNQLLTMSGF